MRRSTTLTSLIGAGALLLAGFGLTPASAETESTEPAAGDLLLANHSFEDGLDGWTGTGCDGGAVVSDAWAADGSHSLTLGSRGCPSAGVRSSAVPVEPDADYTARIDVQRAARLTLRLVWQDASGAELGRTDHRPPRPQGRVEVTGTAPAGAAQVAVELEARGNAVVDNALITADLTAVGPQITKPASYLALGAGEDENGRKVAFSVATGSESAPAKLVVTDILEQRVTRTVDLPGATGSWTVAQHPESKLVYIGTYGSAALWSWQPGADEAVRIGRPPIDYFAMFYGITFGSDGTVYGGGWGEPTDGYAGAALWSYDEEQGFTGTVGPNPLTTEAYYTRWTAYDQESDALFTGTGTKPRLYGCPIGAAECVDFTHLLNPELLELPWLYGGSAGDGYVTVWGGDGNSRGNDSLTVLKVGRDADGALTAEVTAEIKGVVYNGASRPVDGKVYYTVVDEPGMPLHALDLATSEETVLTDAPVDIFSRAWEVIDLEDPEWPGPSIVGWNSGGILAAYNLETGNFLRGSVADQPEQPIQANSVAVGPDGRIWTAGYLTGGLGAYSPLRDDRQQTYLLGGQAEQMITYRGRIYQGVYPYGEIRSFTPEEIAAGEAPRLDCLIGEDQNRPYALLGQGDRVYFGSQAEYGHDQGAFGYLDLDTGECTTLGGVIGNQSINTLAASGGKVFGGGSIFYGYDGVPIDEQAKLLIFDESDGSSRTITWPIEGTRSIDAALTDPTGVVWFYANGWLAALDPETEELIFSEEIFPDFKPGDRIPGNYARMVLHPDGTIYGNAGGRLFGFDPKRTLRDASAEASLKIIAEGVGTHLALTDDGDLYTVSGSRLVRYRAG
ncbi:MAG TPA: hypothetical protein VK020_06110 [Microlunatus sp.]|nr:hypothetical protein [Microlunatus sp.]